MKTDGYSNVITRMGTGSDRSSGSVFLPRGDLTQTEIDNVYEESALAARVVDRLPDDGTRGGIFLTGTDSDFNFSAVQSDLEDLEAVNALSNAWRLSRKYGGAICILNVNDGNTLREPLNLDTATHMHSISVVESPYVRPVEFDPGLGSRAFSNPQQYEITVPFGSSNERLVHRSRVLRFDAMQISAYRLVARGGWGPSVLDRVYTELTQLGEVMGYSRNLMHSLSLMVFKLTNFRKMLEGGEESEREVQKVLESIAYNADNLHSIGLDTEDDMVEVTRSAAGFKDLIDQFVSALVRATDMPKVVLLGEQPSGQNASADSEIRIWFDYVASQQKLVLTPPLNRILHVLFRIRRNNKQPAPDEWTVNYNPLWQPTSQEKADTLLKRAQAAQILLLNGVVSADEVRADLISAGLLEDATQ